MKIGLISDTHGWIHPRIFEHFKDVDEIWHAGDIGNIETADSLAKFKPLRAVYGNIDDIVVRRAYKAHLYFTAEEVKVFITHIGGYPGHFDRKLKLRLDDNPPDLLICGHSHIARIMFDRKAGFLFINPGAAGYSGFHKMMTAVIFRIEGKNIGDLKLIELGDRSRVIL